MCNSGIYAIRKTALIPYLTVLAQRPQVVIKEVNGVSTQIKEFFITDLVEYMVADGLSIGYVMTEDETETMGVDDPDALLKARKFIKSKTISASFPVNILQTLTFLTRLKGPVSNLPAGLPHPQSPVE